MIGFFGFFGFFLAVLSRDLRVMARGSGSATLFALSALLALALARAPDAAPEDPGLIWLIILLTLLPAMDRLFAEEIADGACALIMTLPAPLEVFILAKLLARWIAAQPLLLAAALFSLSLGSSFSQSAALYFCLLPGALAAILLGGLPAALTARLPRAGALTAFLTAPFFLPLLIFGSAASRLSWDLLFSAPSFLLLLALLCLSLALAPIAAAAALRNALA